MSLGLILVCTWVGVVHLKLQETFDLFLKLNHAVTIEDVYAVLLARLATFGVTSVLAGVIPREIVRPADQPRYVVLGHWPEDWAQRYFERQYVRRDPTILHAAEESQPLYWSEIDISRRELPAARIMGEARDFQLKDGVTIPQLTLDGVRIGVSFSGDRIDRSPKADAEYTVLAAYAVNRALEIRATLPELPQPLSPAQRECLLLVSGGLSVSAIGDQLGISDWTVNKHLAEARRRLAALTTPQAVATALRLGLL